MKQLRFVYALLGLAALLAACGGGGGSTPPITSPTPDLDNSAVQAVQQDLAERLGGTTDEVQITSATIASWPDSCLGAPEAGESCSQVVTPGYEVTAQLRGNTYTYRTDTTGAVVRFAGVDVGSNDTTPTPKAAPSN